MFNVMTGFQWFYREAGNRIWAKPSADLNEQLESKYRDPLEESFPLLNTNGKEMDILLGFDCFEFCVLSSVTVAYFGHI